MEIELHVFSFQNPFSLFFYFNRVVEYTVSFYVDGQFYQRKTYRQSLCRYSFPNSFHLTLSTPSQEGSGSISKWGNNAKGATMPGLQDFIFQHPPTPEGGPEGNIKNTNIVFSNRFYHCTQKFMLKSSQLWAPWLQDSSFQHLLDPKAGPEGGIRKCQ